MQIFYFCLTFTNQTWKKGIWSIKEQLHFHSLTYVFTFVRNGQLGASIVPTKFIPTVRFNNLRSENPPPVLHKKFNTWNISFNGREPTCVDQIMIFPEASSELNNLPSGEKASVSIASPFPFRILAIVARWWSVPVNFQMATFESSHPLNIRNIKLVTRDYIID